jgi:phosphoribosylaminoimidazole-succinocarboxamide synthase
VRVRVQHHHGGACIITNFDNIFLDNDISNINTKSQFYIATFDVLIVSPTFLLLFSSNSHPLKPIMPDTALTTTSLAALPKIAEGKVRDLYEVDPKTLLFVATDRISAYDVIMDNVG